MRKIYMASPAKSMINHPKFIILENSEERGLNSNHLHSFTRWLHFQKTFTKLFPHHFLLTPVPNAYAGQTLLENTRSQFLLRFSALSFSLPRQQPPYTIATSAKTITSPHYQEANPRGELAQAHTHALTIVEAEKRR